MQDDSHYVVSGEHALHTLETTPKAVQSARGGMVLDPESFFAGGE
jgi:hypothetical protein